MRTTPSRITSLNPSEIFVFGSNESGRHGLGAAKTAMKWGAKYGQGSGIQGNTYGIPTKDRNVRVTLPLDRIAFYVDKFIIFAQKQSDLTFLVTEIGCGLAGYKPKDIAPLFKAATTMENIYLPESFWKILR